MSTVAEIKVRYGANPRAVAEPDRYLLSLPTDGLRAGAALTAEVLRPAILRDALLTLAEIQRSDLRRKAANRQDYLAYLAQSGKKVTQAVWDAQKKFLAEKYGEAVAAEQPLDPLVTISTQEVSFEVFSQDESAYARLSLDIPGMLAPGRSKEGTTHFSMTSEFIRDLGKMRSFRRTMLELGPVEGGEEKSVRVPYRWLRALGQVQAAATLPKDRCQLEPIDLYNLLYTLRRKKAKKAPRALRYELVPGQRPRMILEPWEDVLEGTGALFKGQTPRVVRTWGRNRLATLSRLLPHAESVEIQLTGAGLPTAYVVKLPGATLTLALSGWTDSGWAGVATFDLLSPGQTDDLLAERVLRAVEATPRSLAALAEHLQRPVQDIRSAVLDGLLVGSLSYDWATENVARRPLLAQPLDKNQVLYRDPQEREAHRLLAVEGQVSLTKTHDMGSEGVNIEGEVADPKAHRSYRSSFLVDREGRTTKASCTCAQYRRAGLREGPCPHMMALRLKHARILAEAQRARQTEAGRQTLKAETRQLIKRRGLAATFYRVTLDERQIVLRYGEHPERLRMVRLLFATPEAARGEYFQRLEGLGQQGYIDAGGPEA